MATNQKKIQPPLIDHPDYYGGNTPYETIKVIEAWYGTAFSQSFCLGNVMKYISRAGKKDTDGLTDLKKAQWYLNKAIEYAENPTEEDSEE